MLRSPSPPSASDIPHTRWSVVLLAFGAGVVSGVYIGKVAPVLPAVRVDLAAGMVTAGWISSLAYLFGASMGALFGHAGDRLGGRRMVLCGLALLALGGGLGATATSAAWLLASRAIESAGFMMVVVMGPRLILAATRPEDRPAAFGLWGCYMPTGMALATLAAPLLADNGGWRLLWSVGAVFALLWLLAVWRAVPADPPRPAASPGRGSRPRFASLFTRPGPVLLGAIFGVYAMQWNALMAWMPSFLIETKGTGPALAAVLTAAVIAANVPGNLVCGWLMRRGVSRPPLIVLALLAMALCGVGIFAPAVPDAARLPLALLFSLIGGLVPAASLASVADHAPSPEQVSATNGVVMQGSNLGSVAGAPLLAAAVTAFGGWDQAYGMMLVCGVLGSAAAWGLQREERRR